MASFAKHLSTHLYFNMERKHGESQSEPSTQRPRTWNKENNELGACNISSSYNKDNPFSIDSPKPEHRGSIMGSDLPEDYFSYSPYLLTPDMSSKSRIRRRYGDLSSRYELFMDDDYIKPLNEHPRLRPPDPSSPISDRRFLPPTPNSSSSYILDSHIRGEFLPFKNEKNILSLQEKKVCILIDFRENGLFASQDLPFPSTALRLTPKEWLVNQLNRHRKAFTCVKKSQSAIEGLLLMNVERHMNITC